MIRFNPALTDVSLGDLSISSLISGFMVLPLHKKQHNRMPQLLQLQIRAYLNERPPASGKITVAAPIRAQYIEARGMIEVSFESL